MERDRISYVSPGPAYGEIRLPQMESTHVQHTAKSDDNAWTLAASALLYSAAYMLVFSVVVAAGAGVVYYFADDIDLPLLVLVALLVWGGASYGILSRNREQGLYHSPTGIAHHQIESEERRGIEALRLYVWAQLKTKGLLTDDDADGHRLLGDREL